MPDDDLRMKLKQADDEVRQEKEHIAHEMARIEQITAEGHDAGPHEKSLLAMHHFLDGVKRHRRILLERLGLYRP